ncbi:carbonic anhydrase [Bacillus toyonensis]|uniref:carbonic anhydrase n=1 Tax=Bacillus toyonensis TaxID=155322 RepID=UPI000BFBE04E|nr:carbonic anhydrase family protein [Bacillus toyonensis]PHG57630.1 carbonic anhydrase [Bacillus toyonensis]
MKGKQGILVVACCFFILSGCVKQEVSPSQKNASSQIKQHASTKQLNYQDQDRWELESGDAQSPIDINTSKVISMQDAGEIELDYGSIVQNETDNGHTIQVDDTGTARINGRVFNFTQFHFHAPSEHTINGKHYPIEAHFVHESQDGRLAVIGVLFQEGKENKGFQEVLDHVRRGQGNTAVGTLDITTMIPMNKSYYHYLGSLTTPPLSENVEWYVMKELVEVSSEQIKTFQKMYSATNRKIQPLHQRMILYHQDEKISSK